jgi:hypothetical protein
MHVSLKAYGGIERYDVVHDIHRQTNGHVRRRELLTVTTGGLEKLAVTFDIPSRKQNLDPSLESAQPLPLPVP